MLIVKILLVLATVMFIIDTLVESVINYRHYERMKDGGIKPIVLSFMMLAFDFLMTCLTLIVCIRNFNGSISSDILTAVIMFVAAVSSMLSMRFRKWWNYNIVKAIHDGEKIKQSRNAIMSNVSHEIRTPMNTIMGMTEILKQEPGFDQNAVEKLDNISQAGANLLGVINNLIDFSKIESDRLDIIECDYSLKNMIEDLIGKSGFLLKDKSVDFLADIDSNMPSTLHGDDVRITQAVTNVLKNACKYTHAGVVTLRVKFKQLEQNRGMIHFDIEDTGIGITDSEKSYIFTAEANTAGDKNKSNKGAGLSLLITKSIIEKMGGSISFTSEYDVGTTFSIDIPQTVVEKTPIGAVDDKKLLTTGNSYSFTAPMAKVLVVDDNIVNLFVAKEILEKYGIDVQTASSGEECINLVNENYYNIIFMDYVMPGMDGHETLLKLRQPESEYFRKIPVIALTAQTSAGGEKMYLDEGFQGYLSKPIEVHELEKVLVEFLPEEFICYKESEVKVSATPTQMDEKTWYKRLCSVLTDFDVKKGLEYCGNDYTSYINLLKVIYADSYQQADKLRSYVREGDIENYRISTHALKSVTASAGAMKLSFIFKEHENAAKSGDWDYIRNHVETAISEYETFVNQIDTILQRESEMMNKGLKGHRSEKSDSEIRQMTDRLIEALEDYNIDDAEQILEDFESVQLTFNQERALADIKDMLSLFKYDEAIKLVRSELQ